MKSIKGILAAAATATALSGVPAQAEGITLRLGIDIDLGNGSRINISPNGLSGNFNIGDYTTQSDPNGTQCRNAAAREFNSSDRTPEQRALYSQRMDLCKNR